MFKREKDLYHKMMEPRKFQINQHTVKLSLNGVEEEYIVFLDKRPVLVCIKFFVFKIQQNISRGLRSYFLQLQQIYPKKIPRDMV